jgi:hypothetical protein
MKKIFGFAMTLVLVLTLLGTNTQIANASLLDSALASLPNPGMIIPIPSNAYAKYSGAPHLSGFGMGYITNKGQVSSSIDLGYSGQVTAPITGRLSIAKTCGDHQIVFIQAERGSDGLGWAIGLTHIWVDPNIDKTTVTQGQVIGKTVKPPAKPGKGCGYGSGIHIHYTLMKWKMNTNGPVYTEQNIVNTYLGSWIVKNTYLDGSDHDIQLGQLIK